MKEISLHILDIVQNSIVAQASLIELEVTENTKEDFLSFKVLDNGKGMSQKLQKEVIDPFITGRTTRKVGLGIPLLKNAAEITGGTINLTSKEGVGTEIFAYFVYSHIDRQPLGDMTQTIHQLITSYEEVDFCYKHTKDEKTFLLDTREIKKILGDVSLRENSVSLWLFEYIKEQEEQLE